MSGRPCSFRLLVLTVLLGVPLGADAGEDPQRPTPRRSENESLAIHRFFELPRPPSPSGREVPSPTGGPTVGVPVPVDKIPPLMIGDLACGEPTLSDKADCQDLCEDQSQTPCMLICTFRKNRDGKCELYAQCTSDCDEIPEDEMPTGGSPSAPRP
jgi:hypothetical protein